MMTFHLLGPFEARADGVVLDLGGRRQQAIVARLLVAGGRTVPAESLIDDVWPSDPPATAAGILQSYVYRLRRVLEPGRGPREQAGLLISAATGYALRAERVDAWRFEDLVERGGWEELNAALDLWRGPAFGEFGDLPWAAAEATRLEELRLVAVERRAAAALRLGRPAHAVPDLEAHAAAHPLREEAWRLLALALYRSGRQGDALAMLRRARDTIREELGLDPGPALRQLEAEILVQAEHLVVPQTNHLKPRLMIVDDHALVRKGLRAVLEERGFDVTAEAADGEEAIAVALAVRPDVVLMDIAMPRLDGLAAARRLLAERPPPKVIMLTTFGDDDNLYAALRAGVSGFVLKTSAPEHLVSAIQAAADGNALIDPAVTTRLIASFAAEVVPASPALSEPEVDLLRLVARGLSNDEIATALHRDGDAIGVDVQVILHKLDLRDRAQAVVYAYESGLVHPSP